MSVHSWKIISTTVGTDEGANTTVGTDEGASALGKGALKKWGDLG